MKGSQNRRTRLLAISISVLVGVGLMAAKFYIYRLTHSAAVLSDALESIINVVAGAFAWVSVVVAAKPPDTTHPYGHGKIEYFSAGFEGALIVVAAVGIFKIGVEHIAAPVRLPRLEEGLLLLLGASAVNLILGIGLIRAGKATQSIAVTADGKHVLTDVYTSAGLVLGLFLVSLTGWLWLDGVIACLVGLNIVLSGGRLVLKAFAGLMDAADPRLLDEIAGVMIAGRRDCWIDVHELRAWTSGSFVHMDLHLVLPRDLSLEAAHEEGAILEKMLVSHFRGDAAVLLHLDPCVNGHCPICGREVCDLRAAPAETRPPWDLQALTMKAEFPSA